MLNGALHDGDLIFAIANKISSAEAAADTVLEANAETSIELDDLGSSSAEAVLARETLAKVGGWDLGAVSNAASSTHTCVISCAMHVSMRLARAVPRR